MSNFDALAEDFQDLLGLLISSGVEFLIIGGHAVIINGHVRATKDLDIWVRPTPENAKRIWQALAQFGAPLSGLKPVDFESSDLIYQIGQPPARIDILTRAEGLDFEACWNHRLRSAWRGREVTVLSLDDLVKNKRAVGRHQDLADAEKLEQIRERIKRGKP